MQRETIGEGPSVAEALDAALEELGVQQDAVEYEVLEEPGRKMLGLGGDKPARVKVRLRDDYADELEEAKRVAREILEVEDDAEEAKPAVEETEEPAATEEPEAPEAPEAPSGPRETVELSEDELDHVADEAVNALKAVLVDFGIEAEIEEYEGDEGEIILDIVGDDLGVLIGRHGKTLDGLQTLVAAMTNRSVGFRYPVIVDVEGYRHRRRAKVEQIARRAADKASRNGQPVDLRPMTSYERRVVHMSLRDDPRVTTSSKGDEPFRHVVVSPK
jgi:spoIIIJ-associated protein